MMILPTSVPTSEETFSIERLGANSDMTVDPFRKYAEVIAEGDLVLAYLVRPWQSVDDLSGLTL